jgi:glycosyltransferase involved in cell wall biosynthesis
MNLKVHFDEQIFTLQEFGGISRYFTELIREFKNHPELGIEPVLKDLNYPNRHLNDFLGVSSPGPKSKLARYLNLLTASFRRLELECDVHHSTFYARRIVESSRYLTVATLYDMIPERSNRKLMNPHLLKRFVLPKADLVLSISKTAANEFSEFSKKPLKQLFVTPLGVSESFRADARKLPELPDKYLLFVGARSGYKRGDWALKLMSELSEDVDLVFVGKALSDAEKLEIKRLDLESRVFNFQPSDSDLPSFYSNSLGLLHLSSMEGFGLPILEGLRSEIPVVLPRIPINLEVAQNHGCFFEAENFDGLVDEVKKTIAGQNWTPESLISGSEYAKKFSWYECARLTAQAYVTALEHKNKGRKRG